MSPDVESNNGTTVLKRVSSNAVNNYLSGRRLNDGSTYGVQIYVGGEQFYVLLPLDGEVYSLNGFKFHLGESRFIQRALFPEALQRVIKSQDNRRGNRDEAEGDIRLILGASGLLDYMVQKGYNAVAITADAIFSCEYPQLRASVNLGHVAR